MEKRPKESYSERSIFRSSPKEGRGVERYALYFNLNPEDLRGKTVLDLGSGLENVFSEELKANGIDATVVALSPDYSEETIGAQARKASPDGKLVAGLGQALPLQDVSFDYVFALKVLDHISSKEISVKLLSEIVRVLKPGGVGKVGPLANFPLDDDGIEELAGEKEFQDLLLREHITLSREDVSEELPRVSVYRDVDRFKVREYNLVLKKDLVPAQK